MRNSKLLGVMAEKGYTQRMIADALGVSKNTVNDKLNGRGCFNTEQAIRICEILDITDAEKKTEIFLQ